MLHILLVALFCATEGKVIVFPKMLESRSHNSGKILKINEDITLNLRKSSVFSEEFLIHTTRNDEPIAYHMLGAELEKDLYDDAEQMAAVLVSEEEGLRVEGVLGHALRIKPLEGSERSLSGEIPHELYTISFEENGQHRRDDYTIPSVTMDGRTVESRIDFYKQPRLPLLITPEVHVVVDYTICEWLNFVHEKVALYVAVMAASANLRYRSIIQPRVQLQIVGVTVTKKPEDEPYMVHVDGYQATHNILEEETRINFRKFAINQPYFTQADIVFLLSGLNLSEWEGNELRDWVGGSAFLGGACTEWKVGISEERAGTYYGVYVFAHELAHSLGCQHDGDGAADWPYGNIGSKDCDWNDGYMMSYMFKKPYMYKFSRCCQREITNNYNRPEYKCLIEKNSPRTGIHTSKLPGDVSSRQVYCQKVYNRYTHVYADTSYNSERCIVRCFIDKNGSNMLISAVDGVECGSKKICILGNCTSTAEFKKATS